MDRLDPAMLQVVEGVATAKVVSAQCSPAPDQCFVFAFSQNESFFDVNPPKLYPFLDDLPFFIFRNFMFEYFFFADNFSKIKKVC